MLENLKNKFSKHPGIFFQNFLSFFFYQITKSKFATFIRTQGRIIAASYDFLAVIIAWVLSYWILIDSMTSISLSFDNRIDKSFFLVMFYWKSVIIDLSWILPIQLILFRLFGLYRGFWRFASIQDLRKILSVSLLGGIVIWLVLRSKNLNFISNFSDAHSGISFVSSQIYIPHYVLALLYSTFLALLLCSARLSVRFIKNYKHRYGDYHRVIIIGAGNAGEGLVRDLLRDGNYYLYKPIVFVDDDLSKLGREIHGIRVAGTISALPKLISKYDINLALIAIPSASSASMRSVLNVCEKSKIKCYTLPGIKDLTNGHVSINILRSISLEDLLGRYPVSCDWDSIKASLANKTILITGGGGSIGSELTRQIASLRNISRLIVVDSNEYNLYCIEMELKNKFSDCSFHPILLNVTDREGIQLTLETYKPEIIFHAAAYKHVPMLENQVRTAIYNNVIGTYNLAQEAASFGVETFVLISTDKAVNPTNIMGATKRAAEYICQNLNDHAQTNFITVRFGNVLNSAGSVIPLFKKQIEEGGPLTVTHPDITRYFMTIPEATQLILQAAFQGQGGEIFVLDMGDPIKIRYLAEQMITLAGKVADKDIKIIYTGLRPGEKLYEECFYQNEFLQPTSHKKILRAQSNRRNIDEITALILECERLCKTAHLEKDKLTKLLWSLVPEYQHENMNSSYVLS